MAKADWAVDWKEQFLERVRTGLKPLAEIAREKDMPNERAIYHELEGDKDFAQLYARAREDRGDVMAQDIIKISDRDDVERTQRDRLRVDTRKFLMAKMAPKKYGDKVEVDLTVKTDDLTPDQLTNEGYASGCVEAARVLFEQGIQRSEQNTQERLESALREADG